jgi:molybdate transport system substrate-binding protein
MRSRLIFTFVAVAAVIGACSSSGGASPSPVSSASDGAPSADASPAAPNAAAVDLTVFAAASLTGVLERAKEAYEAADQGITVTVAPDSSAALATQIQEGAPADVFLSADTTNPQKLVDGGFTSGDPVVFAGNELTIITPTDNPGGLTSPTDLAKDGLKVVAAGDEVPITKYATQLIANLAKEPGYPADFADAYAANVVSKEDNVKGVVTKIEVGEGDAGIVYVTDAIASGKVGTVDIPDGANVPASYSGVVVKASPSQDAAADFLAWFAGPDGQAILAEFGFLPPTE